MELVISRVSECVGIAVVAKSFITKVIGLLYPTLNCTDKFRVK